MYYVARLLFVAALAVTAIAMSASSASAILPVEVMDLETPSQGHCPAVSVTDHAVEGGCHRLVHSDVFRGVQHRGSGDVTLFSCVNDVELRLDENGEGWMDDHVFSPGTANCGTTLGTCTGEAEELHHVQIEHDGVGNESGVIEACLRIQISPTTRCELEGDFPVDVIEGVDGDLSMEADDSHFDVESLTAHPSSLPHSWGECAGFLGLGELELHTHWTVADEDGDPNANIRIEHR